MAVNSLELIALGGSVIRRSHLQEGLGWVNGASCPSGSNSKRPMVQWCHLVVSVILLVIGGQDGPYLPSLSPLEFRYGGRGG